MRKGLELRIDGKGTFGNFTKVVDLLLYLKIKIVPFTSLA